MTYVIRSLKVVSVLEGKEWSRGWVMEGWVIFYTEWYHWGCNPLSKDVKDVKQVVTRMSGEEHLSGDVTTFEEAHDGSLSSVFKSSHNQCGWGRGGREGRCERRWWGQSLGLPLSEMGPSQDCQYGMTWANSLLKDHPAVLGTRCALGEEGGVRNRRTVSITKAQKREVAPLPGDNLS